jgi:flavorubredoxin
LSPDRLTPKELIKRVAVVGAAEGCDLLSLHRQDQDQKIAVFGSSYRMGRGELRHLPIPLQRWPATSIVA